VRGDTTARELEAFWLHSRGVLVEMKVNTWDGLDPTTRLIRSRAIDPVRFADLDAPWEEPAR
jgi:hypothetical protein